MPARPRPSRLLCLLMAAVLNACGGSENSNSDPVANAPAPAPPPAGVDPSEGCGLAPPAQTTNLHVLDGNGTQRTFEVIVSPGYDVSKPVAVVFNFHGAGGSINDARGYGMQDAIKNAGDQGLVVLPQGIPFEGYGVGWNERCNGYDMAFFDEMLKYVGQKYCVDKKRVFASGFSWGGDMTNALACCRGAQIKGVAPVSGPEGLGRSCPTPSARFPAMRYRYGDSDFAYGANTQAQHTATVSSYANHLSCQGGTDIASPSSCKTYRGCSSALMECKVPGEGHSPLSAAEAADTWRFWKALQ